MFVALQGVSGADHKDERVHPDNRFLHPDEACVENITHDNDDKGNEDHQQRQPGC